MDDSKRKAVLYASVQNINDLCCFTCEINYIEVQDSSAKSNFHWRTMKCRLIIYLLSEVIASPKPFQESSLFVITSKEFFKTGKLQAVLTNLNLFSQGPHPVTEEIYQLCLMYTIECKISPSWNKIGQFLVQGKEFYNEMKELNSVELQIFIRDDTARLHFDVAKFALSFLKLEHFDLSSSVITEFLADSKGSIDFSQHSSVWVHVLPSMKRARVLSISKEIPAESPFSDYEHLRRHWKNMYGYRLPRTDNDIIYYRVKFSVPGSTVFTYPNLCLTNTILHLACTNPESIISQFVNDLLKMVPSVCGKELRITKNKDIPNPKPQISIANTPMPSTPTNKRCLLSNDVRSVVNDKEREDFKSPLKLEFSARYISQLRKDRSAPTPLNSCLKRIQQIHSTFADTNSQTNVDSQKKYAAVESCPQMSTTALNAHTSATNANTSQTQPGYTMKNRYQHFTGRLPAKREETVSTYFTSQQSGCNIKENAQNTTPGKATLKERLLRNIKEDENVDVEAVAKEHKLSTLKTITLRNWMKQHQIPYTTRMTKAELINKIQLYIKSKRSA